MRKAYFKKHTLEFHRPAGTSRGVLTTKDTWYLIVEEGSNRGIGECGMFAGLSIDYRPDYEQKLRWVCDNINNTEADLLDELRQFPSIQIGLEMAFNGLRSGDPFQHYPSDFSTGNSAININGLIWMGDKTFMQDQIQQKLEEGFDCIKMKVGAIDFKAELDLLEAIRNRFSSDEIVLRADANGAFSPDEALSKLEALSTFDLHSIEQPIRQGQWDEMRDLCAETPIPIALDEELIGIFESKDKSRMLDKIMPQFIILKPTLIGGFNGSDEWIALAEERGIGWWVTSALESNIGLNAISQYTFLKNSKLPQGLGTGGLFTNNIPSPLEVRNGKLHYNTDLNWDYQQIHSSK